MSDRYFVEPPIAGDCVRLEGAEAHHLAHVMRANAGDEVTLFDGGGAEFVARVDAIRPSSIELSVLDRREVNRELLPRVTLAVSLPKGDRQRWLVEKATELGVARLIPLVTARSVAQPVVGAIARLARTVIEASKQCGRNRLMEISQPRRWQDFVTSAPASAGRWIAHPIATDIATCHPQPPALPGGESFLAIGPEGGFTDDEVREALDAGWRPRNLGPRVLRVETAAIALAAWAALACGESAP